jgi:hypothetical protein
MVSYEQKRKEREDVEYRLRDLLKDQAAVREEMQSVSHKLQEAQSLNK